MEKYVHIRIEELLKEKGYSKNKICNDLNLIRTNLNKDCRDDFKRIDAALIIKLCEYFKCSISDLLEIREKPVKSNADTEPQTVFKPIRTKP